MQRPGRFEHTRYLGDKRTQLVYDVDAWSDSSTIDDRERFLQRVEKAMRRL